MLVETRMDGFDVRSAVVLGSARAVVFDTLAHPSDMAPVRPLVEGRPVTVVYSHADWDHAWGTCGLDEWGEVIAHSAASERFRDDVPRELAERRASSTEARAVELVPPDRAVTGGVELDLGDVTLALSPLPGHTPDSLVAFARPWGVLLAGDAVETPLPVVNDVAALPGWIGGLETWARDPAVTTVVPSHGRVGGR
ncbi:MAG TPA: MBL fold metallo-hydrolase, partial [Longimicrobiales bacterium]|nr:MBL fold metallo-hydrolase [Longimicrobiales bacterium]